MFKIQCPLFKKRLNTQSIYKTCFGHSLFNNGFFRSYLTFASLKSFWNTPSVNDWLKNTRNDWLNIFNTGFQDIVGIWSKPQDFEATFDILVMFMTSTTELLSICKAFVCL